MDLEGVSGHPTHCASEQLTLFPLKKNTFVSPLLCLFTWLYFPIGKNSLLRASTPTDSLEDTVPFLPRTSPLSPTQSTLYPQDAGSMFLLNSSTYLPNMAWNPIPTTYRISNPKLNITDCDWLTNTVVPRALAASSQCPRRKSLLEPSSTSMSINRFWNSWEFCL